MHPKASNIGVWGETGRYPLTYECLRLTFNYYNRIQNLNDDSFLSLAFKAQKTHDLPWYHNLTKILTTNLNSCETNSTTSDPPRHPSDFMIHNCFVRDPSRINQPFSISQKALGNLKNNFTQCWNLVKEKSPKLSFYHQIKPNFGTESYLSEVTFFKHRSAMTRLRISAHDLQIETGRYNNQAREERICKWCQLVLNVNSIENEQHFLLECDLYTRPRRAFLSPTQNHPDSESSNLTSDHQVHYSLTLNSFTAIDTNAAHNIRLAKTISNMFKIREKFIESTNQTSE